MTSACLYAGQRILTEQVLRMTPRDCVLRAFSELGTPDHAGHAFVVTRYAIGDTFGGIDKFMSTIPRPDYEHAIWLGTRTGDVLVVRPDKNGKYDDGKFACDGKRLR